MKKYYKIIRNQDNYDKDNYIPVLWSLIPTKIINLCSDILRDGYLIYPGGIIKENSIILIEKITKKKSNLEKLSLVCSEFNDDIYFAYQEII